MVLENGCLCCTVFGDLVTTLNNLYHSREDGTIPRFDHVVIETSGLADPSPLIQAFLSDPTLAGLYRIATVVATVDAVNGPGTLDNHAESVRQVALADHILITKLDLIDTAKAKEAEAALTAPLFPRPVMSARAWAVVVYHAFFGAVAHIWWYRAVERVGASRSAVFLNITPIVGVLLASVLLAEPIGIWEVLGTAWCWPAWG